MSAGGPLMGFLERNSINVCFRCRHGITVASKLPSAAAFTQSKLSNYHSTSRRQPYSSIVNVQESTFRNRLFFWHNGSLQNGSAKAAGVRSRKGRRSESTVAAATGAIHNDSTTRGLAADKIEEAVSSEPTHRSAHGRRKLQDKEELTEAEPSIPLDASNRLSSLSAAMPTHSLRRLFTIYLSLSKPRLTFLVVLTATAAYTLYPVPTVLSTAATHTPSLSALTLLFLTTGTFLTSASANALNMMMEPAHDAKMSRTRNRPLVRGLISQRGALFFAIATGLVGTAALYTGVNPTTSFLAFSNILLYAFVYTPLKRIHVINTWVGAVVGGIPPLMGWTAAAGQCATGAGGWQDLLFGESSAGGWLLAGLLYAWQFPHFNALSWTIREEYKYAGYKMLAWTNSARNARVALRYAILLVPICVGLASAGVVEWAFVPASLAVNGWQIYEAFKFYKHEGKKGSARGLFWASVWHLPVILVMAMFLKKGLWDRVWEALFGPPTLDEEAYYDEDEDEE